MKLVLLFATCLSIVLLGGCVAPPQRPGFDDVAAIKRMQVVPAASLPETSLDTFAIGTGEGAAKGAAVGAVVVPLETILIGSITLGPIGGAIGVVLAPVTAVIGAIGGASAGAIESLPPEKAEQIKQLQQLVLAKLSIQQHLATNVARVANGSGYQATDVASDSSTNENYQNSISQTNPESAVLKTTVEKFQFSGGGREATVAMQLKASAKLFSTNRVAPLGEVSVSESSEKRTLSEWLANEDGLLEKVYDRLMRQLADGIVDYFFLANWPKDIDRIITPSPLEPGEFSLGRIFMPIKVSSLPLLQWEPYGTTETNDPATSRTPFSALLSQATNIQYDLCIFEWRGQRIELGKECVYRSLRVTGTEHQVQEPLTAGKRYRWIIRARIKVHGRELVTPWSGVPRIFEVEMKP